MVLQMQFFPCHTLPPPSANTHWPSQVLRTIINMRQWLCTLLCNSRRLLGPGCGGATLSNCSIASKRFRRRRGWPPASWMSLVILTWTCFASSESGRSLPLADAGFKERGGCSGGGSPKGGGGCAPSSAKCRSF